MTTTTRPHGRRRAARCAWAAALAALTLAACDGPEPEVALPVASYDTAALRAERQAKNEAFRGPDGPLMPASRAEFPGLSYFEPNPSLVFSATLQPSDEVGMPVKLLTTKGDQRLMHRAGFFLFEVDGQRCTLHVYRSSSGEPHLFLPFKDATNGRESYEVGRYLDLEEQNGSGPYLLDFNRSYNPYCAYNEDYSCPIVPPENVLSVPIAAGERAPTWLKHAQ